MPFDSLFIFWTTLSGRVGNDCKLISTWYLMALLYVLYMTKVEVNYYKTMCGFLRRLHHLGVSNREKLPVYAKALGRRLCFMLDLYWSTRSTALYSIACVGLVQVSFLCDFVHRFWFLGYFLVASVRVAWWSRDCGRSMFASRLRQQSPFVYSTPS